MAPFVAPGAPCQTLPAKGLVVAIVADGAPLEGSEVAEIAAKSRLAPKIRGREPAVSGASRISRTCGCISPLAARSARLARDRGFACRGIHPAPARASPLARLPRARRQRAREVARDALPLGFLALESASAHDRALASVLFASAGVLVHVVIQRCGHVAGLHFTGRSLTHEVTCLRTGHGGRTTAEADITGGIAAHSTGQALAAARVHPLAPGQRIALARHPLALGRIALEGTVRLAFEELRLLLIPWLAGHLAAFVLVRVGTGAHVQHAVRVQRQQARVAAQLLLAAWRRADEAAGGAADELRGAAQVLSCARNCARLPCGQADATARSHSWQSGRQANASGTRDLHVAWAQAEETGDSRDHRENIRLPRQHIGRSA
mmetsp:Transcript_91249/g.164776  ORF Transcript_91249/g.164776 Transcript_91249/m.164776 type:complete len:378 (-) Transcript_91249:1699-2832(-)